VAHVMAGRASATEHERQRCGRATGTAKEDVMLPTDRQLLAQYHHADRLREAHQARLAKQARSASRPLVTQRLTGAPLGGALAALRTRLARGGPAVTVTPAGSVSGHVLLRSSHLR
ncbi:MAG: hypothetical protein ACHQZR_08005, partial [Candidatus Limnocylindrales bacterium]